MQKYNIQLEKSQIFSIIAQLNEEDKTDLLKKLQNSTWLSRFAKVLATLSTEELTTDEITKAVEEVRQKRFDEGKH